MTVEQELLKKHQLQQDLVKWRRFSQTELLNIIANCQHTINSCKAELNRRG